MRKSYGAIDVWDGEPEPPRRKADPSYKSATLVAGLLLATVAVLAPSTTSLDFEGELEDSRMLEAAAVPAPTPATTEDPLTANCGVNTWVTGVFCDNKDPNCKYAMRPACTAKFTCHAGNYCGAGAYAAATPEEANTFFVGAWWPNNRQRTTCEVTTDNIDAGNGKIWYGYACRCNPGFYCPENIALPRFCPSRWECQNPAKAKKCPKGSYCRQGCAYRKKCTMGQSCEKHVDTPSSGAFFLIWFVILVGLAYVGFLLRDRYKAAKRERTNHELEDYYDVLHSNDEAAKQKRASTDEDFRQKLESMKSGLTKEDGYRIEFNDLRLTLPGGATVMRGPSGALECGKSTAIMGASGAGKTTIMNLITGKVKKTGGTMTVNGEPCEDLSQFRSRVAFVPQEDVMHRELTVLDNINFSAQMRLPANWTHEQKNEKVMHTLCTLDLMHIQHSIIGDEFERGISGGQRKRVNVGLELVADPKVLFLDEPTSGLDSVSATKLCKILRKIAEEERLTIAAVIHSPGPEAFMAFHNFILLQTGGRLVYYGPMPKVEQYFEDIGFKYPRGETLAPLADHILLKVAGESDPSPSAKIKLKAGDTWDHMTGFTKLWHIKQGIEPPHEDDEVEKVGRFAATKAALIHGIKDMPRQYKELFCPGRGDDDRPTISSGRTFFLCFRRACNQNYQSFSGFFLSIILFYAAVGFFFAGLFTVGDVPPNVLGGYPADVCGQQYPELRSTCKDLQSNDYTELLQAIFWVLIAMGASTSASTFGCETAQYWRECSVGLNTPAYFCAKSAADFPVAFVSTIALWAPMAAIFVTPMSDGYYFLMLMLLNIFGFISGYFISFIVPYTYCGVTSVIWAVFWGSLYSGFSIPRHQQSSVSGLFYMSPGFWFMQAWFQETTVHPFKRVRGGRAKNEPYYRLSIGRAQTQYAAYTNFSTSVGWMIFAMICLWFIDLWVITTTQVHKKK